MRPEDEYPPESPEVGPTPFETKTVEEELGEDE
jgi:hypothetical protein